MGESHSQYVRLATGFHLKFPGRKIYMSLIYGSSFSPWSYLPSRITHGTNTSDVMLCQEIQCIQTQCWEGMYLRELVKSKQGGPRRVKNGTNRIFEQSILGCISYPSPSAIKQYREFTKGFGISKRIKTPKWWFPRNILDQVELDHFVPTILDYFNFVFKIFKPIFFSINIYIFQKQEIKSRQQ